MEDTGEQVEGTGEEVEEAKTGGSDESKTPEMKVSTPVFVRMCTVHGLISDIISKLSSLYDYSVRL